jgi:UDP-glucose 4-epimerase
MGNNKYLIFGANGYMGRHLAKTLRLGNHSVGLFDLHPNSLDEEMRSFYKPLNLLEKDLVDRVDFDVEGIYLFSGLSGTSVGFKKYRDFIKVNEIGLLNVLDRLKETNCQTRVVFPSSRLVYKGQKDRRLKEDDPKEFKTLYAINKFAFENYLTLYHQYFGLNYTIFRICVPYGNLVGAYSYGTTGFFLNRASKGDDLVIYGDGSQRRTFTHIADICQVLMRASFLSSTLNDVFNIGGENFSIFEFAKLVGAKFGVKVSHSEWPQLDRAIESGDTIFDSSKLDAVLNYKNQYNVVDWLNGLD